MANNNEQSKNKSSFQGGAKLKNILQKGAENRAKKEEGEVDLTIKNLEPKDLKQENLTHDNQGANKKFLFDNNLNGKKPKNLSGQYSKINFEPNQDSDEIEEGFSVGREILRKIFHLILLSFPAFYYFLGQELALKIIAPAAIVVVSFDYLRSKSNVINRIFLFCFGAIMRQKEKDNTRLTGTSYALIAAVIIFLLVKEEIIIASFLILAICDLAASLIGKSIKSRPFYEKSLAGSVAFYIFGILIVFLVGSVYNLGIFYYIFAIIALFFTTIIEARPSLLKIDDNFTIPFTFAFLMSIFDLMWNII